MSFYNKKYSEMTNCNNWINLNDDDTFGRTPSLYQRHLLG